LDKNGIPRDGNGKPLKMGQQVRAVINKSPPVTVREGRYRGTAIRPKEFVIFGKILIVGSLSSIILPDQEREERVENSNIEVTIDI